MTERIIREQAQQDPREIYNPTPDDWQEWEDYLDQFLDHGSNEEPKNDNWSLAQVNKGKENQNDRRPEPARKPAPRP